MSTWPVRWLIDFSNSSRALANSSASLAAAAASVAAVSAAAGAGAAGAAVAGAGCWATAQSGAKATHEASAIVRNILIPRVETGDASGAVPAGQPAAPKEFAVNARQKTGGH